MKGSALQRLWALGEYLTIYIFFLLSPKCNLKLVIMHVFCELCDRQKKQKRHQHPDYCSYESTSSPLSLPSYTKISPYLLSKQFIST